MDGDLLVTSDTECSDGVAGFAYGGEQKWLMGAWSMGQDPPKRMAREDDAYCKQAFDQIIVRALWQHG